MSNNIVGGERGHPLFSLLTDNLLRWQVNYILPYVTIMYASGQWYFTAMWERYHSLLSREESWIVNSPEPGPTPLHHILMDGRPGADPWVFFTQVDGNSWANWDNRMFSVIGDNIAYITLFFSSVFLLVLWACIRYSSRRSPETAHKQSAA